MNRLIAHESSPAIQLWPGQFLTIKPGCNQSAACRFASVLAITVFFLIQPQRVAAQTSPATLPDLKLAGAGTVNAMVLQDDGKIVIGGEFTAINGVPRRNIARINPNGSVDATWIPTVDNSVTALALSDMDVFAGLHKEASTVRTLLKISRTGDGQSDAVWNPNPSGDVKALALSGTNLFVGGLFQAIGGLSRTGLAKINITGVGAGDPAWALNAGGLGGGYLNTLTVSGTNLYVGGGFQTIGSAAKTNLARIFITTTGTVDAAWSPNPVPDFVFDFNEVTAIAVSETNVFVGGTFTKIGGQTRANLAKVSTTGNGAANATWNPACVNNGPFVSSLAVSGTNLYVVGYITCMNGQSKTNVARLSTLGTGASDSSWNPRFDANTFGVIPNGSDVYFCGIFRVVNGAVSLGLAKLDSIKGNLDTAFHPQVERPGIVYSTARQPDGKLVIGGSFWSAGGLPRQNIARMNVDGSLDYTWAPFVDDAVIGIAANEFGIYIRGSFLNINGTSRSKVAKLFVNSDGLDAAWNPNPNQGLSDLAVSGTNVFVCGNFSQIGGSNRLQIAKLNGNGTLDVQWSPNPTGSVSSLIISGQELYVGGSFSKIGGLNRTNLARLSTEGTGAIDATWNPNAANRQVRSLALDASNIFVSGRFTNSGDYFGIRKVSRTGTGLADGTWNVVDSGFLANFPFGMSISGTNLYASGNFTQIGGVNRRGLARIYTTGTGAVDTNWNPKEALIKAGFLLSNS